MSGTLQLTEHQTWALTIALELEQAGWLGAAKYLRGRHFPRINWNDPAVRAATKQGFNDMLRIHHGSVPPVPATPAPQPQVITPTIRPDQTTS